MTQRPCIWKKNDLSVPLLFPGVRYYTVVSRGQFCRESRVSYLNNIILSDDSCRRRVEADFLCIYIYIYKRTCTYFINLIFFLSSTTLGLRPSFVFTMSRHHHTVRHSLYYPRANTITYSCCKDIIIIRWPISHIFVCTLCDMICLVTECRVHNMYFCYQVNISSDEWMIFSTTYKKNIIPEIIIIYLKCQRVVQMYNK